jgi:rod shape-determining protein MreC
MLQGNDILSSANTVSGIVYQKREDVIYYFGLRQMNDSLLSENLRLRAELAQTQSMDTLMDSLATVKRKDVEDSGVVIRFADYHYRAARVINNSVTAENNYITINRGRAEGIRKKMAVLSGTGVVGRVAYVSEHYASVLSILSQLQNVNARLKDGTFGRIVWESGNPEVLILKDIPPQVKVKRGDSVFTTGYSFFPPDVLIGRVLRTETIKKNNLQLLYLQSATNFRMLQYVYVVENTMTREQETLEDSTQNSPR